MALRFSIVIPSYMQARWLGPCIRSVLGQEGVTVQAIVMDGGSTDGSREVIESFAPRLSYWQSQKDGGQAAAIRAGFERADGDILGWLNSDDVLMPGALARVAAFFEAHPEEEAVTGGGFYIDAEGRAFRRRAWNTNHVRGVAASHRRFLYCQPQEGIWQPCTFWRRTAYEAVGGVDPQFHYMMDFDLFTRLAARRRFAKLPAMLACFRIHEDNKTHQWMDVYRREFKVWEGKYGLGRQSMLKRKALYGAYMLPAALRRAWGVLLERGGFLKFDAPVW
jgi:glycosyltransferase involved in cell wall biosynthesis